MSDPLVAEFCRSSNLQDWFIRKCQREFRSRVQSQLDERVVLLEENERLKARVSSLEAELASRPRGPGRPRKPKPVEVSA